VKTRRLLGSLAALAVAAAMVPANLSGVASATATCTAPTTQPLPGVNTANGDNEVKDVVLAWSALTGATTYDVQVSLTDDFTDQLAYEGTSVTNRLALPDAALPHGSYFWRVRVGGAACWSDDGSAAAAAFTVRWPAQVPITCSECGSWDTAHLSWPAVPEASSYDLEISTQPFAPQPDTVQSDPGSVGGGYNSVLRCFVQQNSWAPYQTLGSPFVDNEKPRLVQTGGCVGSVADQWPTSGGTFYARVRPLDDVQIKASPGPDKVAYVDGICTDSLGLGGDCTAAPTSHTLPTALTTADWGLWTYANESQPAETPMVIPARGAHAGDDTAPGNVKATVDNGNGVLTDCTHLTCQATPTISWDGPTGGAGSSGYRVTIASDRDFSNITRVYDTLDTRLTPREDLRDTTASSNYYVAVQSCNVNDCGKVQTSAGLLYFQKRTPLVTQVAPATGAALVDGSPTFRWTQLFGSGSAHVKDAAQYQVQVSSDCLFGTRSIDALTDTTIQGFGEYTSPDLALADGTWYWRVRSIDASGGGSAWSKAPNSGTSTCTDVSSFTVNTSTSTTGPGGGTSGAPGTGGASARTVPLSIHYGTPVTGLTPATVQLIEGSTGRVVPAVFTALSDGASLLPAAKDLVAGETYTLRVNGIILDGLGRPAVPLTQTPYRAATKVDVPGVYVHLKGLWQSRKAAGALSGAAVVTTSKKRPSATLVFRGSGVTVGYCKGPLNGYIAVYVDGKLKKTVSTYSPFSRCGLPGVKGAPSYTLGKIDGSKQHTITVVETGKRGARKGRAAALDYFNIA
jgi:hypothetical protein